jgi:hypothetical protein
MSKSKAYSAVPVNHVLLRRLSQRRDVLEAVVADLDKFRLLVVPRWPDPRPTQLRVPSFQPGSPGSLRAR